MEPVKCYAVVVNGFYYDLVHKSLCADINPRCLSENKEIMRLLARALGGHLADVFIVRVPTRYREAVSA